MASSKRAEGTPAEGAATTRAPAGAARAEKHSGHGDQTRAESGNDSSRSVAPATELDARRISCLMNATYHAAREAYLDTVHRWFMFAVIALGAVALTDLFPKAFEFWGLHLAPKEICAAAAAVIAALDLTFDLSNRARNHALMKRRYYELLADVHAGRKSPSDALVAIDEFASDEEPPYKVLLLACWNAAQKTVYGDKALQFDIPKWALLWKNFLRRPTASFKVIGPA